MGYPSCNLRGGNSPAARECPCVLSALAPAAGYFVAKSTWLPLTPALSPQARLGELATPSDRIRKRMRWGRGERLLSGHARTPSPLAGEGWGEGEPHTPRVTISAVTRTF